MSRKINFPFNEFQVGIFIFVSSFLGRKMIFMTWCGILSTSNLWSVDALEGFIQKPIFLSCWCLYEGFSLLNRLTQNLSGKAEKLSSYENLFAKKNISSTGVCVETQENIFHVIIVWETSSRGLYSHYT